MLFNAAIFLAAAVILVPLSKRLGLGAVLGYLLAGLAIGPWGLRLVTDVDSILHFSEFGIVLFLFVVGLELQPSRLWRLRREVFLVGGGQVFFTLLLVAGAALAFGLSGTAALVTGFGLAMSSTAFVLTMLAERKEMGFRYGRLSFAILLFQDLAVIPFLALVPLLAGQGMADDDTLWLSITKVVSAVALLVLAGRYLLRPLFRFVATTRLSEVFTAAALLVVISTSLAMDAVGLSMSLGAFLAGVLLADSEYRHELQADIEPFKGLLLGLFFMAVGMSANLGLLFDEPLKILGLVLGLLLIKACVLYALGRAAGADNESARALAVSTSQGGEFAFVLFGVAAGAGILDLALKDLLVIVVTLSMMVTPPLFALLDQLREEAEPVYDEIRVAASPVIIAGFGPFGQIVGRLLRVKKIPFTVLERDWQQVDFVRRFGNPVFYSDGSRVEVLRAAHADQAKLFVVAIAEEDESLKVVETVRHNFPHLRIFAMAVTRQHALNLLDLKVTVIRRSLFSSLEMARQLLLELGQDETSAARAIELFRKHDEETLQKQHAVARDEEKVIQTAQEAARELEALFQSDKPG